MPSSEKDYWAKVRDRYMADPIIEASERVALKESFPSLCPGSTVLDLGAGDPARGRDIIPSEHKVDAVDFNPHFDGVEFHDIVYGPTEKRYDAVLCCRVLSNVSVGDRRRAINNILASLKSEGYFLFADSTVEGLKHINKARADRGWDPLPKSTSGSVGLSRDDLLWINDRIRVDGYRNVAADYVIWSRAMTERLLSYDCSSRDLYPVLSNATRQAYALYIVAGGWKRCT